MNKYAKKWVEALRSGKYQQGMGQLASREVESDGFCYCCLGVACEILKDDFDLKVSEHETYKLYDGAMTSLPNIVITALNLKSKDGKFIGIENEKDCLISLNDSDCMTFAEIADVIESEPEGLFHEDE